MTESYDQPTEWQKRYWKGMVHLQVHIHYLESFQLRYQTILRRIEYFLAITSSASIGGWAIWHQHAVVWAVIIAGSQVLNAIKHILPYSKRLTVIQGVLPELNKLLLDAESRYYAVSNGLLTDEEIHNHTIDTKRNKDHIATRLDEHALPDDKRLLAKAEERANTYFDEMYG